MDLLTRNVTEINRAFKKFNFGSGTMKAEDINAAIALAKEAHAIVRTTMQAEAMAKRGHMILKTLDRKNFYCSTTAADIDGDPETDKVKCPYHDDLITRSECLDYSGDHFDECSNCEIGTATKNKLLPESR